MRPLPFDLVDRYADWRWTAVRDSTYMFAREGQRRFVKLAHSGRVLPDEAEKLRWARKWLPVPEVVEFGSDGETDWLMTVALDGVGADTRTDEPRRIVTAFAEGLRAFHSAVPPAECPFGFTVPTAVAHVKARLAAGLIEPEPVERLASAAPASWTEVVAHGDYRLPNALLSGDTVSGYLDLGALAVADPWWDLAKGAASVTWNLGHGYEDLFYDAYGIIPDRARIAWYGQLNDLS